MADFPAAHFSLGTAHCPVGFLLLLGVFSLIAGHMASLVLFNFLKAGSTFWLQTYYREKVPTKVWIVLECTLRGNA